MALFSPLFSHQRALAPTWTYDARSTLLAGPTVIAVGNARAILLGTKDGRIVCLDENGKERWSFATDERIGQTERWFVDTARVHAIDAPPVVADIDGDGRPEILAGSERGILYCLDAGGTLKWKHDCEGQIRAAPAIADINGDGRQEVLIGSGNNRLTAITGTGQEIFAYQGTAPVNSTPGVLHLPKRRTSLIIFGDESGALTAITAGQEVAWRVDLKAPITAAPAFFSDPEEERLVIGTHAGLVACVSEHGEVVWEYKTGGSVYAAAAIADLNNDRTAEIVVGSCDNTVHVITLDGRRLWTYETGFWVTATPLIADLDGDGTPEVVAGSYDRAIYILDGPGTYIMDYVPGIAGIINQAGHYGSVLTSDVGEQTGKLRWKTVLPDMVLGCALLPTPHGIGIVASAKNGAVALLTLGSPKSS